MGALHQYTTNSGITISMNVDTVVLTDDELVTAYRIYATQNRNKILSPELQAQKEELIKKHRPIVTFKKGDVEFELDIESAEVNPMMTFLQTCFSMVANVSNLQIDSILFDNNAFVKLNSTTRSEIDSEIDATK